MTKNKIFLLTYKNRSGSTFLMNKLDTYKDICSVYESNEIVKLLENPEEAFTINQSNNIKKKIAQPNDKLFSWNLCTEDLKDLDDCETKWDAFKCILQSFKNKHKPNANHIIFKHPKINSLILNYSDHFLKISDFFLIILIRDGRAIYASSKLNKQSNKNIPMEVNPFFSARGWKSFMRKTENNLNRLGSESNILVRYEDLVEKNEQTLKKLILFLGCKNETSISSYSKNLHENQKHLHPNINKKANVNLINSWKNKLSKNEIKAFQFETTNYLENYDYEVLKFEFFCTNRKLYWLYCLTKSIWYKF